MRSAAKTPESDLRRQGSVQGLIQELLDDHAPLIQNYGSNKGEKYVAHQEIRTSSGGGVCFVGNVRSHRGGWQCRAKRQTGLRCAADGQWPYTGKKRSSTGCIQQASCDWNNQ